MKTLPRGQSDALFDRYWDGLRQEWFKLEVLQDYSPEDDGPSLRSWIRGDRQKSIEQMDAEDVCEWERECQQKARQGVKLIRIRLLKEPYTTYLRWELEYYKHVNIPKCGERVFLVNQVDTTGLNIPKGDLMIFDNRRAVVNEYDSRGWMTHQIFYDENDDISGFVELAKKLKNRAKKLPA